MRNYIKKYLLGCLWLFLLMIMAGSFNSFLNNYQVNLLATVLDLKTENKASPAYGFAWNDNVGWINFGTEGEETEGQVYVSNSELYGYAWGENIGWIDFAPSGGGVLITTNSSGINTFSGNAWGENIGWITFDNIPGDNGVKTTWIKHSGSSCQNCTYTEWTECADMIQTRTASHANCCTTEELSRSCVMPIDISIDPTSLNISTNSSFPFSATVTGTSTTGVNWSISEGTIGGNITNAGIYTSSSTPGIYHIIATSIASSTVKASSTVTVKEGIGISISPATSTIYIGESVKLTATVTGTSTTGVNWSIIPIETIAEGFYGKINPETGTTTIYSSPANALGAINITIQARAQADINKVATANIVVRPRPVITLPECTNYNYSTWSVCENNNQNRSIISKVPTNCSGGLIPNIIQSCANSGTSTPTLTDSTDNNSNTDNNNLIPITNIENLDLGNIAVLGTTTGKIILNAKRIVSGKTGLTVTNTITTAGVIIGGAAATGIFALNGMVMADLLLLPFRLWALLLSALGLKKRKRPWGTVYDSVTKQPIDPAYVTLKNIDGSNTNTSITDLDGRYGFLVPAGRYILIANKTNYLFPSQKLSGKTEDTLYSNLYFGEELNIQNTGALISKNIPLDPLKFDWNEFIKGKKKLMKFYSRREKIVRIITDWIFRIGFIVSLISLFLVTAPYNIVIFILYLLLLLLRKFGLKQKVHGSLLEKNGDPLSFAIIRIFSADLNVEITNKVADRIGQYYCLVSNGKYYARVEKKNDDESYSTIYTSPVFETANGIINKSFTI